MGSNICPKMYFSSLQTLRGLFAIVIFFHHFSWIKGEVIRFEAGGDMGVAFFFILSGFVITQSYMPKLTTGNGHENIVRFVIKRLSKIYPLHVVCLVASVIYKVSFGFYDVCNLLLLQSWIPLQQAYFSGNVVAWCLSDFLFFYGIFPLLCSLLKSDRRTFLKIYLAILFIYMMVIIPVIPSRYVNGIVYISPLTRLLDFVFGMLLAELFVSRETLFLSRTFPIKMRDAVVALAVTTYLWYAFPSPFNLSILWWPSLGLLILAAISSRSKVLTLKPLVKFGDVSFSFYLIHVLSMNGLDKIFVKLNLMPSPAVRFAIIFSLTIVFAFVAHYCFVVPVERYIRRKIV